MKTCPFCAAEIQDDAVKCKHCGEAVVSNQWRSYCASYAKMSRRQRESEFNSLSPEQQKHFVAVWKVLGYEDVPQQPAAVETEKPGVLSRLLTFRLGGLGGIVAGLLILVVLLSTSVYTIDPEEVGVVVRLGKYAGDLQEPGLHLKVPFGVDRVFKVGVQRELKQEFGFRTVPGRRTPYPKSKVESNMLTGDLKAVVVEWVVQYRVVDPYKFLFKVRGVEATVRDISEAVMRSVVGDRTLNEVLTVGRREIEDLVKEQMQELCNQYETGIRLDQVVLVAVNPVDQVKPSVSQAGRAP